MSVQDVTLAVVVGVLVRFAIPVGLTLLAIWLFRKLDQRWKAEAEEQTRLQVATAMANRTPCWEQKQCSPEKMQSCPAYAQKDLPCWQVMRDKNGNLKSACLECSLFRNVPVLVHH
ncbi:MAG TPA: hypothetical protein VMP08_12525 [Anaerolineae bacterium]|nr:hypothetical protein [Anaerolineae bacterium]